MKQTKEYVKWFLKHGEGNYIDSNGHFLTVLLHHACGQVTRERSRNSWYPNGFMLSNQTAGQNIDFVTVRERENAMNYYIHEIL